MAGARRLLHLWLGCLCVSLAHGQRLKQHFPELREPVPGDRTAGGGPDPLPQPLDKVSEHMLRLYDRYRGGGRAEAARTPGSSERGSPPLLPQPLSEGNTVRSFRAAAAGECPRRPLSALPPQVSPGTPTASSSALCYLETFPRPPAALRAPRSCHTPHPAYESAQW
uniref:Bone morphogenetic protein 3 n=1 Tax=Tursiops truncatus TaxID=9739 RepID=A0A6J3RBV9_TURTR|nr:bone morphogenetic protein 3 [Tursiops truncatus]